MPGFPTENLTDNQAVDPSISTANEKQLLRLISDCSFSSDIFRNRYANMTSSWIEDATKYESLYDGKLYDKRQKLSYECKEDIYRDLVDFNSSLLSQFDYKEDIRKIGDEINSIPANLFMRFIEYAEQEDDCASKEEDANKISGQMGVAFFKFKPYQCEGYWWPGEEVVDPRQVFISPGARSVKDAVFLGWKRPVPTSELKQNYPDKAELILPDAEVSDMISKPLGSNGTISVQYLATGGLQSMKEMYSSLFTKTPKLQTMVTEFYYMDPEVMEIGSSQELMVWIANNPGFGTEKYNQSVVQSYQVQLGNAGGKPIKVKKYPFGRMILATKNCVLSDIPNPYYRIPFFEQKCFSRPRNIWAKGVCEVVREPVQNYHLMGASLSMNLDYNLRPTFQETNVRDGKTKQISMQPNSCVSTAGEIKPIGGLPIAPQGVMDVLGMRKSGWENTSGLSSTLGGVNPTGNYSSLQLDKLMDGALGKVAPRLREKNRCKQQRGEMKLWFCQNYCTDEREIYFMDNGELQSATVNNYTVENNSPVTQNDVSVGKYKYILEVDIKQPATQQARQAQYQNIAKIFAPFAPIEAARIQLESMSLPGKQQMINRFEKAIMSKQEQEQANNMRQFQIQQMQIQQQADAQKEKNEIERIKAGASAEESASWVITNLTKAGIKLTPEFMQQLSVTASAMTHEVLQNPQVMPPQPLPQPAQPGQPQAQGASNG